MSPEVRARRRAASSVPTELPESLEELAKRVLGGDVVFFIGSGFSIDSEWNTTARWIRRLLVRVVAFAWSVHAAGGAAAQEALHLLRGLETVFGLRIDPVPRIEPSDDSPRPWPLAKLVAAGVEPLSQRYYEFNEWAALALHRLVHAVPQSGPRRQRILALLERLEPYLLRVAGGDDVPLDSLKAADLKRLRELGTHAGKALFLDTMGFHQSEVMAGVDPGASRETIRRAYGDRIRPRHLVLARLAREGLCTKLVTTNYDLLFDGAFRLVGLHDRDAPDGSAPEGDELLPPATYDHVARIRSLDDHWSKGGEERLVRILKIHGCADLYRRSRRDAIDEDRLAAWGSVARDLVFTYREIQNWRRDDWARDLLRTLLRSQTMAFAGYSAQDQVIHNTLRNVYEELAAQLSFDGADAELEHASNARAYFFDVWEKREFHALEVLRAASSAAGCSCLEGLHDHPNLIPFSIDAEGLSLDDLFLLLQARVLRSLQRTACDRHLYRAGYEWGSKPLRPKEAEWFRADVAALCESHARASAKEQLAEARWVNCFLTGFLRQAAIASVAERQGSLVWRALNTAANRHWYAAIGDYPEQATIALIVEVALRKMTAVVAGESDWPLMGRRGRVVVDRDGQPWIEIPPLRGRWAPPSLLAIRSALDPSRPGRLPECGVYSGMRVWSFDGAGSARPWCEPAEGVPSLRELWTWAIADVAGSRSRSPEEAYVWLCP